MDWSDLSAMSLPQVHAHNARIAFFARRVYAFADVNYVLQASNAKPDALVLHLRFGEHSFMLGLSRGIKDVLLAAVGASGKIDGAWEQYLIESSLKTFLPPSIVFESIVPRETVPQTFDEVYTAQEYGKTTDSPYSIGFVGAQDSLAMVELFDHWVAGVTASPLAQVPINLPLISCTFTATPKDIETLAVGDVFLL